MKLLPYIVMLGAGLLLASLWLGGDVAGTLSLRLPDPTNEAQVADTSVEFKGTLTQYEGQASDLSGRWPHFRGPRLNAIVTADLPMPLRRDWTTAAPTVLWDLDLGEGYAGAAIGDGRVFIVDYDQEQNGDAIRCLSLDDGRDIWRYFYPVKIKRNHGMSRTIPALVGDTVISLGPKCHLLGLEAATGMLRWKRDLVREDGVKVPAWYAGQCPLVDGERLILGVGGDEALVMALDAQTGTPIWKTPNPKQWTMTHSSIAPMDMGGTPGYVYCASKGVVGVAADDGRQLWAYPDWHINIANVPTPVVIDQERIFLSGGYNMGSMMLRVRREGDRYIPEEVFRLRPKVFGSDQQTPIFYEGYLYGVRPDEQLVCLNLDGEIQWTSSSAHKFGLGPYTVIDQDLYVLNDEGLLSLIEAQPTAFTLVSQAQVLEGHEAWGPMAYASGRLIVRDLKRMVCLELSE